MNNIPRVAIILAAGKGSRLDRPDTPKPLVKIGNKPLIVWNIEYLQDIGVKKIYISLGYRGEEIKKELTNNPLVFAKLEFVYTEDYQKTGMFLILRDLLKTVDEPFFVSMADLIVEKNPYTFFQLNKKNINENSVFTLVDTRGNSGKSSGALSFVCIEKGNVLSVGRNLKKFDGTEVGIYLFGKGVAKKIKSLSLPGLDKSTFSNLLQVLIANKYLKPVVLDKGEWFDVNTPITYTKAEMFFRSIYSPSLRETGVKKFKRVKGFKKFNRIKNLATNIVIETNILNNLDKYRFISGKNNNTTHFLLTDSNVDPIYGRKVAQNFKSAGYDVRKLVVPAGEKSKSIQEFSRLSDEIFSRGMDKNSFIVSLGGGVVNNIAGFLATVLYRGIGLIHIPTTSMAQVDAAIDFKQAINSTKGKNLLGSYYPASYIIIDPRVLLTLDDRNLRNGFSESIKHALTQDKAFLDYLISHRKSLRDVKVLDDIIKRTIKLKVPLLNGDVGNDFNEMIPQYGHCVGHAIEHLSSYDLLHGEAIAIGMCITAEVGYILGICKIAVVDYHYKAFAAYNLPTRVPGYMTEDDIITMIRYDKHHVERPFMSLIKSIGNMFHQNGSYSVPVDYEILRRAIKANKNRKYEK